MLSRLWNWASFRSGQQAGARPTRNQFKALAPATLLKPHQGHIAAIRARVGVTTECWDALYAPVITNYAGLVQRVPASESHHHADPGGLLRHGLEVACYALELRQGVMLPLGAAPEAQARLQDLWTYACLTAALLHDLGKPVTDQKVTLYNESGQSVGVWSPVNGPMALGVMYRVEFNRDRLYRQHERIPALLAHHLVPASGLDWIAADGDALDAWLAAIQGNLGEAGAIGEIIGKAHGLSVARDLSGGPSAQLLTARAKPLAERLLTGLRYIVSSGALSLNRRGASGFFDGQTLWLVSKTALDALRTHLIQEGQAGIPARNDRLMDELQQHGLLVANGERAIWRCTVQIEDWYQELTCLRFEAAHVWPEPSRQPEPMSGSVTPRQAKQPADNASEEQASDAPSSAAQTALGDDDLPLPYETAPAANVPDGGPSILEESASDTDTPVEPSRPDTVKDAGQRFVAWLTKNIEEQQAEINTTKARLHVVPEGLALVSPAIFRDFDAERWQLAQKRFQKMGLHRKTPDDRNIWTYQAAGSRKQALIKVILIPNPESALGVSLPGCNPAVSRVMQ